MKKRLQFVILALNIHSEADLGIGGRNASQVFSLCLFCSDWTIRPPEMSELARPYQKL
jgi:hypothetical protein